VICDDRDAVDLLPRVLMSRGINTRLAGSWVSASPAGFTSSFARAAQRPEPAQSTAAPTVGNAASPSRRAILGGRPVMRWRGAKAPDLVGRRFGRHRRRGYRGGRPRPPVAQHLVAARPIQSPANGSAAEGQARPPDLPASAKPQPPPRSGAHQDGGTLAASGRAIAYGRSSEAQTVDRPSFLFFLQPTRFRSASI